MIGILEDMRMVFETEFPFLPIIQCPKCKYWVHISDYPHTCKEKGEKEK